VPASSFFAAPDPGRRLVRFAFCKTDDVLAEAGRRLAGVRRARASGPADRRPVTHCVHNQATHRSFEGALSAGPARR